MKKVFITFFFFCFFSLYSQEELKLNEYSFEEIEILNKKQPKPILIFFYADWCKVCFGMKKTSFKSEDNIKMINKNFYFIPFNGEHEEKVKFLGKEFKNIRSGNTGTHEIAIQLATINNKIVYPTIVLLNPKYEIDVQINNYLSSKELNSLIKEYLKFE